MYEVLVLHRKKLVYVIAVTLLILALGIGEARGYEDLSEHWAEQDIYRLTSRGIVEGFPQGDFQPDGELTRAQLTKMLIQALNRGYHAVDLEGVSSSFDDVPSNHWASGYMEAALELGLVEGYDDGTFRPNQNVTRAEMIVMAVRGLEQVAGHSFEGERYQGLMCSFSDSADIPSWASRELNIAVKIGLFSEWVEAEMEPNWPATRAETASSVQRLLEVDNRKHQFYGEIVGGDPTNQLLMVKIAGREENLPVASELKAYHGNKLIDWWNMLPGQWIYFNVNREGKVSYMDLSQNTLQDNLRFEVIDGVANQYGDEHHGELKVMAGLEDKEIEPYVDEIEHHSGVIPTASDIKADAFRAKTEATGEGTVVAVVDTGIDPGHPDLQKTSGGSRKVLDVVDFTTEGIVETVNKAEISNQGLKISGDREYDAQTISSKSGQVHYGYLERPFYTGLNSTLVVLADAEREGHYDTVYLDITGKGDFVKLKPFHINGDVASFQRRPGEEFNLALSQVDSRGGWVQFSYDGHGHGTHVAGILAGNGELTGVAPGTQLIVVKAVESDGKGDWENILQAVKYAAERADVVNLSLGYYDETGEAQQEFTRVMEELARERGTVFVTASGNEGPGLGTLTTPGNVDTGITVGAYISPEVWRNTFGWSVDKPSLWAFSSTGPKPNGSLAPMILAPGSVVSAAPLWTGSKYFLDEGTSMAVPHVAGAIALLADASNNREMEVSYDEIKDVLLAGADELEHLALVEQGRGTLNLLNSWELLQGGYTSEERKWDVNGVYARQYLPREIMFTFENKLGTEQKLDLSSDGTIISPQLEKFRLPANGQRRIIADVSIPERAGLHSFSYNGIPVTVINPIKLDRDNEYSHTLQGSAPAGQHQRYYFNVGADAEDFRLALRVLRDDAGEHKGRGRLHVFDPQGKYYDLTPYTGVSGELENGVEDGVEELNIPNPDSGVWEVIVYSSPALSSHGRYTETDYSLTASTELGSSNGESHNSGSAKTDLIIGSQPVSLRPGQKLELGLEVRERDNLKPYNGTLIIGSRSYVVVDGYAKVEITPSSFRDILEIETR
ncbi:subtilisin family serine protease [Desulfitispora alkaliphila]|uniref:S8 family serine peptidase n=1 Tax=Desulfitispora alkaliphila TaxID=622674 RepID=UPI003D21382C